MEAVKAWLMEEHKLRADRGQGKAAATIDLHLATLDDAIEALGFEKVVGK